MRIAFILLATNLLAQVTVGPSISGSSGLGYSSPSAGAFVRIRSNNLRVMGNLSRDRKWFIGSGFAWGTSLTYDIPLVRRRGVSATDGQTKAADGLSLIVLGSVGQQRNPQYVKTSARGGAGLRYAPLYVVWLSPDSTYNRAQGIRYGAEYEARRWYIDASMTWARFYQPGIGHLTGWSTTTRFGYNLKASRSHRTSD